MYRLGDGIRLLPIIDCRGSGFKIILDSYEFQEHYTEEMKPEFKSSNREFWVIFKNLNYNAKNIGNDLSAKNADNKMPIKTEQQLEKIPQYLSEQSECSCKDICMLLDVKERRARQLLQEL